MRNIHNLGRMLVEQYTSQGCRYVGESGIGDHNRHQSRFPLIDRNAPNEFILARNLPSTMVGASRVFPQGKRKVLNAVVPLPPLEWHDGFSWAGFLERRNRCLGKKWPGRDPAISGYSRPGALPGTWQRVE